MAGIVTFQQMLILADPVGVIDMTAEAIAMCSTIPLEIIIVGITALEQPDPESRSPTLEGRQQIERERASKAASKLDKRRRASPELATA